eukprot:snap_masked-scaffold_2-processed-gene-24.31-mRNA-1 protein AED:1.00 eAED:1.00 QI:0/-1/0/0/-1/1/1/0/675
MNSSFKDEYSYGQKLKLKRDNFGKMQIFFENTEDTGFYIPYNSTFRTLWDLLIMCFILHLGFKIPFLFAFQEWSFSSEFETVVEICFVLDIVFNFVTSYLENGEHVTDKQKIAKYYIRTWFFLDLLALIPVELLVNFSSSSSVSVSFVRWLKIPKLLRMFRLANKLRKTKIHLIRDFFLFGLGFLFLIHVFACLFINIFEPCNLSHDFKEVNETKISETCCSSSLVKEYYFRSVLISLSSLLLVENKADYQTRRNIFPSGNYSRFLDCSTGNLLSFTSDNVEFKYTEDKIVSSVVSIEEKNFTLSILTSFIFFFGLLFFLQLIAECVSSALRRTNKVESLQKRIASIKIEMEHNASAFPLELRYKVSQFYDYFMENNHRINLQVLQDPSLCLSLKKELALHFYGPLLMKVGLFKEVDLQCLYLISIKLKVKVFLPNDFVFYKGDVGKELFFVQRGVLAAILHKSEQGLQKWKKLQDNYKLNQVLKVFKREDSIGETKLVGLRKRSNISQLEHMEKEFLSTGSVSNSPRVNFETSKVTPQQQLRETQKDDKGAKENEHLLFPGSYFGEVSLIRENIRSCSIQSKTFSELCTLSREEFQECIFEFPLEIQKMKEKYEVDLFDSNQTPIPVQKNPSDEPDTNKLVQKINAVEQKLDFVLQRLKNLDFDKLSTGRSSIN